MKARLFLIILMALAINAKSQNEPEVNVAGLVFLDYGSDLPETLLSKKSVVLVSMPVVKGTSKRDDWRALATEAHSNFSEWGIDPVAYYYIDDVLAGKEISNAFAAQMTKRQIGHIILLSKVKLNIKGKESERYVVAVTDFSGDEKFMEHGAQAWKTQNKDLDKALDKVFKAISKSGLEKNNLLVSDNPEFVDDISIINGARSESFIANLKQDKLAIPAFTMASVPDDRPGGIVNNQVAKEVEKANAAAGQNNSALKRILEMYPHPHEIVNHTDEKQLQEEGFTYVMYKLNSSGYSIKKMLDYDVDGESDFITLKKVNGRTILRTIPVEAAVHKYYIKHLVRGDVYLGNKWDADETWADALRNHLTNLLQEIK